MPRKREKIRRLWLNIKARGVKGITREQFIKRLLRSIDDGTYRLPREWKVILEWRNTARGKMRRGEWTAEMRDSRRSSEGWDYAVYEWLERKL